MEVQEVAVEKQATSVIQNPTASPPVAPPKVAAPDPSSSVAPLVVIESTPPPAPAPVPAPNVAEARTEGGAETVEIGAESDGPFSFLVGQTTVLHSTASLATKLVHLPMQCYLPAPANASCSQETRKETASLQPRIL